MTGRSSNSCVMPTNPGTYLGHASLSVDAVTPTGSRYTDQNGRPIGYR